MLSRDSLQVSLIWLMSTSLTNKAAELFPELLNDVMALAFQGYIYVYDSSIDGLYCLIQ